METKPAGKKEIITFAGLGIITKFLTYILLLIFANFYTQTEYGRANFVLSIFMLSTAFVFFGLPQSIVPFYVKERKKVSTLFYFYALALLAYIITGIIIFRKDAFIIALILSSIFLFLHNFFIGVFQSQHKYHLFQVFNTLVQFVIIILSLLLFKLESNGIILSYSLAFFISGLLILIPNYNEIFRIVKPEFDYGFLKKYLKSSFVIVIISYSYLFLGVFDSSILGLLSDYRNVAIYSLAGQIANIITIVPVSISMFLLTRTSQISDNHHLSYSILSRSVRISFFLSIIGSLILASFANLITKIFIPLYSGIIESFFIILLTGIIFYSIYYPIYFYYMGKLKINEVLFPLLFATFINIILDVLLIPKFGVYGVTIATLIAHISAFTLLLHKVKLLARFWPVYFIVLFIPLAFYLKYSGLFLIFLAIPLLFALKLITLEDIKVITTTFTSFISPFLRK